MNLTGGDFVLAIKKFRERMNWTQAELAEKCGVVKSAVSMWESGERMPPVIMLLKLAKIFDCTADDLLVDIKEKEV